MNNGAPLHLRNGSTASNGRVSGDHRHMSTGSLNMPNGPQNGTPRFDGPRSPPGKQNTSHVPCKFFKQGTCQAGAACPFSHDLNTTQDTICKYFSKGNCKFGARCANVHVLPNGLRVNYQKNGSPTYTYPNAPMNLGGRINPDQYHNQSSALTNGFMAHTGMAAAFGPYPPMRNQEEAFAAQDPRAGGVDLGAIPTIDTDYASRQASAYGSPRDDLDSSTRSNLGLSPGNHGLSILDAPLPPSFDSTGVSLLYRNGPQAASVPSKFGLESSPQSLMRDVRTSDQALKDLHNSVFGDDTTRDRFNGVPSSPPNPSLPDGYFGKRSMHSQQQRIIRPKMMSSSVPKGIDRDWDINDFENEEDCLPENLKDLLTPMEKARRGSRNAEEEGRPIYSGPGTPGGVGSKVGSPSNASPSRWGSTFLQKQLRDDEEKLSRTSQFGHVGSPLRPSSLHSAIGNGSSSRPTPMSRPGTGSGDVSPYLASPPRRQAQVSLIAQGIQRVRLGTSANENGQHTVGSPGGLSSRITSNPTNTRRELGAAGERAVSSSSIGTGRFATTPIDEEQPEFVFDMDEDEAATTKRLSGGWGYPVGGRSPHLGALGARAPPPSGVAANGTSNTNGNGTPSNFPKLFESA